MFSTGRRRPDWAFLLVDVDHWAILVDVGRRPSTSIWTDVFITPLILQIGDFLNTCTTFIFKNLFNFPINQNLHKSFSEILGRIVYQNFRRDLKFISDIYNLCSVIWSKSKVTFCEENFIMSLIFNMFCIGLNSGKVQRRKSDENM